MVGGGGDGDFPRAEPKRGLRHYRHGGVLPRAAVDGVVQDVQGRAVDAQHAPDRANRRQKDAGKGHLIEGEEAPTEQPGSGGLRQSSFGGFSGIGDSETDLSTLERREEGWRALISSVVQLIRPVKPTLLREALKSAEVMLHQEQARAAANLGQPPSPIAPLHVPAAVAAAPEARQASRRNAPARNQPTDNPRRDALVSPCRVTRSASKRLATSNARDDGADEPAGEAPVNSGLRRRSSVRLRAGNDGVPRGVSTRSYRAFPSGAGSSPGVTLTLTLTLRRLFERRLRRLGPPRRNSRGDRSRRS